MSHDVTTPPVPFATHRGRWTATYQAPIIHWTRDPWNPWELKTLCGKTIDRRTTTPYPPEKQASADPCKSCQRSVKKLDSDG